MGEDATNPDPEKIEAETIIEAETVMKEEKEGTCKMVYGLEDVPPWYATLVFGFQQFLASFGGTVSTMMIIVGIKMCMSYDPMLIGRLISTGLLICGIGTLLQSTFGSRLAIIQGAGSFFVAVLAILDFKGPCPDVEIGNSTQMAIVEAEWSGRILEISGAILVGSSVQVILGATGCIGLSLNLIGPLTVTPAVALGGWKLITISIGLCGDHWGISGMTVILIILFAEYFATFNIPVPAFNPTRKLYIAKVPIFGLFPIVFAIAISWLFCLILTISGVFPDDPSIPAYSGRTDTSKDALMDTPWFLAPYPGQWGRPFVTVGAVCGILAGVFNSILDSIADYYACARISAAPKPPNHAVNRGIMMEGLACLLGGTWGTGIGVVSYGECIGTIGLTRVGSRTVAQAAGIIMIATAFLAKFGALLAAIPYPIIGGTLLMGGAMVTAIGLSNLQFIDLNSPRNLLIVGFSLGAGYGIPVWLSSHHGAIRTGSLEVDSVLTILLSTDIFVGGIIGFVLDNTIPGTKKERGMLIWLEASEGNDSNLSSIHGYNLPFGMEYIRRSTMCTYLPFSPTFRGFPWDKPSGYPLPLDTLKHKEVSAHQVTG